APAEPGRAAAPAEPVAQPPAADPDRATGSGASLLPAGWRRAATPLLGRDTDLATVLAELTQAGLVTIVGTGGVGKTRLAAEIARQRAATGDPVRVVELAGVRSGEVAGAVATAI